MTVSNCGSKPYLIEIDRFVTQHQKAATIRRSLIDKITLHPGEKRGELSIERHGDFASAEGGDSVRCYKKVGCEG